MILTKNSFRTLKNALMQIEGNPGSARLGEIIARGMGFPDYHALKTHVDKLESALALTLEVAEPDDQAFARATAGLPDQTRRDMQATFGYFAAGPSYFDELDTDGAADGGRVRLESLMPAAWREAAADYLPGALQANGGGAFRLLVTPKHWQTLETTENLHGSIARVRPDDTHPTGLSPEEEAVLYGEDGRQEVALNLFLEGAFLRARDTIDSSLRDRFQYLVADSEGVRAVIGTLDGDGTWEFVYLTL